MNIGLFRDYIVSQKFQQKISWRLEVLQECETNPVKRVEVLMNCQEDFFYFVDLFGVVYEPRLPEMPDVPFFAFEYQRETAVRIMEAEQSGSDLLIEKTRDMGITWLLIWYALWKWLFAEKWYCLLGSRKEEEVDNKSPQSLFGKLRYGYYTLPQWLRPTKFKKSENDIFMKFVNPDKMNYIDGESANPNFGRGKRAAMIIMDELFFWKFARESWRSATDSTPCRIAVSTPKASSFARQLRESFKEQGKVVTLEWKQHPFKDEAWYKNEIARRESDPLAVDAELEIKYTADPTLAYYPEVNNCPVRDFGYDRAKPLYLGLDFGAQDKTAITYWQRDQVNFYCIDGFEKRNKPLYWYYPFLKPGIDFEKTPEYQLENKFTREKFTLRRQDYLMAEIELIKRFNSWSMPVMYCGESAHKQKMLKSNSSIQQELAGIGVPLRINDMGNSHLSRRTSTKKMLTKTIFANNNGALDVMDALANSTFPLSRDQGTSEESKDKPVHNEFADLRAAVENFAVNIITSGTGVREFKYRK